MKFCIQTAPTDPLTPQMEAWVNQVAKDVEQKFPATEILGYNSFGWFAWNNSRNLRLLNCVQAFAEGRLLELKIQDERKRHARP